MKKLLVLAGVFAVACSPMGEPGLHSPGSIVCTTDGKETTVIVEVIRAWRGAESSAIGIVFVDDSEYLYTPRPGELCSITVLPYSEEENPAPPPMENLQS